MRTLFSKNDSTFLPGSRDELSTFVVHWLECEWKISQCLKGIWCFKFIDSAARAIVVQWYLSAAINRLIFIVS